MSTLGDEAQRLVERARAEGLEQGRAQATQEFFGQSAIVLLSGIFAQAMANAAQVIRAHSPAASDFFGHEAQRIQEFGTAPKVTSVSPATDAAAVALDSPVVLTFATRLDPASVTGQNVYLMPDSGGNHISGEVAYDEDSRTVTFTPESPLSPGVTYRVTATGAVSGHFGQPMTQAYTSTFTTEDTGG